MRLMPEGSPGGEKGLKAGEHPGDGAAVLAWENDLSVGRDISVFLASFPFACN